MANVEPSWARRLAALKYPISWTLNSRVTITVFHINWVNISRSGAPPDLYQFPNAFGGGTYCNLYGAVDVVKAQIGSRCDCLFRLRMLSERAIIEHQEPDFAVSDILREIAWTDYTIIFENPALTLKVCCNLAVITDMICSMRKLMDAASRGW